MAVVLVVEDNSSLRSLVCRHIARRGHKAIAAGTGAEALACAARRVPTIAILSLRLPDTDGLRLFDALRGQQPDLAGVLVIPDGGALSSVEYLDSRISACVEKPFDLDTLGLLI
jgi:DNA-binding response OmpR family regulator